VEVWGWRHGGSRTALRAAAIGAVVAVASTLAMVRPVAAAARPSGPLVPRSGALLGAYVDPDGRWGGNSTQESEISHVESLLGRKLAVVQHYYSWTNTFPSGLEQWDIAGGRIPLVSWHGASLSAIISGKYDSLIRARADGLRALGAPVFLRWCWEMNGDWSDCDGSHNNSPGATDGPAKYVAAWRHIHDMFAAEGASNVIWIWSPNNEDVPSASWNHYTNYYPGDAYVDWVGIDGYNWGDTRSWSSWSAFSALFAGVYSAYASRKPILVAETASAERGGSKAKWISDAHAALESRFPSVAAFLWFDVNKENDWRFNSSTSALQAFRSLANDPYFGGEGPTRASQQAAPLSPISMASFSVNPRPLVKRTRIAFRLASHSLVTLRISRASTGHVVRTLRRARAMGPGLHSLSWWGRNDRGHRVLPGKFIVEVLARSASAQAHVARSIMVLRRR
jgi:Glycosyl hydrolase family 26